MILGRHKYIIDVELGYYEVTSEVPLFEGDIVKLDGHTLHLNRSY